MIKHLSANTGLIVFRVDSSITLGSGHVMRCLTLARELRWRGADVEFVCQPLLGNLVAKIEQEGFVVHLLAMTMPRPARTNANELIATWPVGLDADETLAAIGSRRPDWLVCDHYGLDAEWQKRVASGVNRLLAIEDLGERQHVCDVLLDQNWYGDSTANRYLDRVTSECLCLLGPRYALLRKEYSDVRKAQPLRDGIIRRVLVFFGGSDLSNETGKALAALCDVEFKDLAVDVVVGANHPDRSAIERQIKSRGNAAIYENVATLAGLMVRADVAIGAGGSTTWERMCVGLPSIVTTIAENQVPFTQVLSDEGRVQWVGDAIDTTPKHYSDALRRFQGCSDSREPLVDGYGVKRVAETMLPSPVGSIKIRRAQSDDVGLFFEWRNEPSVREMSFDCKPIAWGMHLKWFESRLVDPDSELYVAEIGDLPVGQVRLQFSGDKAVLSYSLDRLVRGRGWSYYMLVNTLRCSYRAKHCVVLAHVKMENEASKKVFRRLGWAERQGAAGSVLFQSLPN